MRPEIYETMSSMTAAHARDLGYVQFHPGNDYVYFIKVVQLFADGTVIGPGGECPFCKGDTNIGHWFDKSHVGQTITCPLCKGEL